MGLFDPIREATHPPPEPIVTLKLSLKPTCIPKA